MQIRKERLFVIALMLLIIIQPILDLMWFNNGTIGEVFGFSVPTLFRIGLVGILAISSLFLFKFKKSHLLLVAYIFMLLIYFVIHHINALNFASLVPGDFNYNLIGELFYIIRMCIPIIVMYFVYNSDFVKKHFIQSVLAVVVIISAVMIVTNLFKISVGAYYETTIAGNFIDWFRYPGAFTHRELASKGWFYNSIISIVLVLLLPYVYWLFIDTQKIRYAVVIMCQMIALFMFGTKASSYSVIIIAIIMFLMYEFFSIVRKHYKFSFKLTFFLIVLIFFSVFILKYSPNAIRTGFEAVYKDELDYTSSNNQLMINTELGAEDVENTEGVENTENVKNTEDINTEIEEENINSNLTNGEIIVFFNNNYQYMSISEVFLKTAYPYEYDPQFWYEIYTNYVPSQTMQNRFIQEKILVRVKEINNNVLDDYFGIGYTRTSSIFNLEKDFIYQFYSLGIIGASLLVGPYILILIFVILYMLKNFKLVCNMERCSLVLGAGLTCCLAYFSGNTLETLGITIILGCVYGYLLKSLFKKK